MIKEFNNTAWPSFWTLLLIICTTTDLKGMGGTSLVVQWLRFCIPSSGGLSLMLGQGTRSHMLQLRCGLAKKKKGCWSFPVEQTTAMELIIKVKITSNMATLWCVFLLYLSWKNASWLFLSKLRDFNEKIKQEIERMNRKWFYNGPVSVVSNKNIFLCNNLQHSCRIKKLSGWRIDCKLFKALNCCDK